MLRRSALDATLWSAAELSLRQGLQFCISIALARLLSPEEFGVVALLSLFTALASTFVEGGLSTALIQRQDITHDDESTVFWFNLGVGVLAALALWAGGTAIAGFYALPLLAPLAALMGVNVFLGSLGVIHGTLLAKRLNFRALLKVGLVATVSSGAVAIFLAWKGFGVWALAAQALVMTGFTSLLLWLFSGWRPRLAFSVTSARRLFGFGGYMLVANLVDTGYNRAYTLLLGRFYGIREVGFYNQADTTKQMPAGLLVGVLSRVAFPMFSSVAHDNVRLRRGTQLAVRSLMLLNVPMMLGLAAVAEPFVLAAFGPKWLPAAPILQVLCLAGIFWPLHVINLNVLMAQGHSRLILRIEVAKKLLGICLLVAGTAYGILGIAWSQVVFAAVAFLINARYTGRFLGYGVFAQSRDFMSVVAVAVPMTLVVFGASAYWQPRPIVELLTLVAAGSLLFFSIGRLVRLDALHDIAVLWRSQGGDIKEGVPRA
jgi:teichuronic acid exporter